MEINNMFRFINITHKIKNKQLNENDLVSIYFRLRYQFLNSPIRDKDTKISSG